MRRRRLRPWERHVIEAFRQAMDENGVPEHPGGKCPAPDCNCVALADVVEDRALEILEVSRG